MSFIEIALKFTDILSWPIVVIIALVVLKKPLQGFFARITHADLPGGVSVDLNNEVKEAGKLSQAVVSNQKALKPGKQLLPLNDANRRLIDLGMKPSPVGLNLDYYREISQADPNLALAGVRIELEIMAKNLAKGFKLEGDAKKRYGSDLLRRLLQASAITKDQYALATKIQDVCNRAVHGEFVSTDIALQVIDSLEALAAQYLRWLSWGFPDGWAPPKDEPKKDLAISVKREVELADKRKQP